MTASFIRVGAVIVCAQCKARCVATEQNVRRQTALAMAGGATMEPHSGVLLHDADKDEEPRDPADTDVTGLSGLSGLMKDEPRPAEGGAAAVPEARVRGTSAATGPSDALSARQRAAAVRRSRQTRGRVIMLITALGIVTLLGVGLYVMSLTDTPPRRAEAPGPAGAVPVEPTTDERQVTPDDEPGDIAAPAEDGWPVSPDAQVIRLDEMNWQRYTPPRPITGEPSDDLRLANTRVVRQRDGSRQFVGDIISDTGKVIDRAIVTVMVTDAEMAYATAGVDVTVSMMTPFERRDLLVLLPPAAADGGGGSAQVASQIAVKAEAETATVLPVLSISGQTGRAGTRVRIHGRTPRYGSYERLVFHLEARDGEGIPVGLWRVASDTPVEPDMPIDIVVALPSIESAAAREWVINGYALE